MLPNPSGPGNSEKPPRERAATASPSASAWRLDPATLCARPAAPWLNPIARSGTLSAPWLNPIALSGILSAPRLNPIARSGILSAPRLNPIAPSGILSAPWLNPIARSGIKVIGFGRKGSLGRQADDPCCHTDGLGWLSGVPMEHGADPNSPGAAEPHRPAAPNPTGAAPNDGADDLNRLAGVGKPAGAIQPDSRGAAVPAAGSGGVPPPGRTPGADAVRIPKGCRKAAGKRTDPGEVADNLADHERIRAPLRGANP